MSRASRPSVLSAAYCRESELPELYDDAPLALLGPRINWEGAERISRGSKATVASPPKEAAYGPLVSWKLDNSPPRFAKDEAAHDRIILVPRGVCLLQRPVASEVRIHGGAAYE